MDFVKAAIICLLIKTYESDALYNEIDRYYSELTSFHLKTMSDMLFSFLSGDQIEQLVSDAIDALFEDDEDDDGQDDDEIEGDDAL